MNIDYDKTRVCWLFLLVFILLSLLLHHIMGICIRHCHPSAVGRCGRVFPKKISLHSYRRWDLPHDQGKNCLPCVFRSDLVHQSPQGYSSPRAPP